MKFVINIEYVSWNLGRNVAETLGCPGNPPFLCPSLNMSFLISLLYSLCLILFSRLIFRFPFLEKNSSLLLFGHFLNPHKSTLMAQLASNPQCCFSHQWPLTSSQLPGLSACGWSREASSTACTLYGLQLIWIWLQSKFTAEQGFEPRSVWFWSPKCLHHTVMPSCYHFCSLKKDHKSSSIHNRYLDFFIKLN